jgi:hypothetical protein
MYISICEYQVHTYMNIYQRSMSIYLFERSMQVSGTSTPYGDSSMRGYLYNVVVCVHTSLNKDVHTTVFDVYVYIFFTREYVYILF